MSSDESVPRWMRETPEHLKIQEMCITALAIDPWRLYNIPENLKTQKNV